ncbi:carbohydrate porin [Asticcacaulis solisilvae]|uniref:carbohydrate porin n=1 Tax=Asticcacaulis solisilvae TaxID=1217274 RepID=UPI003FD7440D
MRHLRWLWIVAALAAPEAARAGSTTYDAVLTTDVADVTAGGVKPGANVLANLDLTAVWKGGDGWEAHGYVLGDFGGGLSQRRVGDIQGVDNIDAVPAWRLFEAYVKKTYAGGHLISSFGLMNLNGVFDVQKYARLFLNSSHGIGPEFAQTGPSIFPISGLGTMTSWIIDDRTTFKFGLFDGVPGDPAHPKAFVSLKLSQKEGANYIVEYKRTFAGGYFKLDHWGYTAAYPRLDGQGVSRGNAGTYGQLGFTLAGQPDDAAHAIKGWLRLGQANGALNAVDSYRGLGVYGPGWAKAGGDQMGFAIAQVRFSAPYRQQTPGQARYETDYELSYSRPVTPAITLQPDVQLVVHPGARPDVKTASVFMLRSVVDFAAL